MEKEIGALWLRKGKKGEYMTGAITINDTAYEIVCFTNQNKKSDRHPDWRIFPKLSKEQLEAKKDEVEKNINPEDIPF